MWIFGTPNVDKMKAKKDIEGLTKARGYQKGWNVPSAAARALAWVSPRKVRHTVGQFDLERGRTMGRQVLIAVLVLAVCALLMACGPSEAEREAQATAIAANIFATQTAEAPTPTPTSTATSTPTPTPIPPTPTSTPMPPTPTATPIPPTPTSTPMPGWAKFEAGRIEIWLPESYEGGDPSQDLDLFVEEMKALGPDFAQAAEEIERDPSAFVFWAFDSDIGDSGFLTNVNIVTERVLSALTIETYLDAAIRQLPSEFNVVEQETVSLDHYQAGRVVMEISMMDVEAKQVMYIVKEGNVMWIVTFGTDLDEFDRRLPTFEQSIRTFKIHP